jgi:hypothetical protein
VVNTAAAVCPVANKTAKNDGKQIISYPITQKNGSIESAAIPNSNIFLHFQEDPS